MSAAEHPVIRAFAVQARWAQSLQAPFTARLLARAQQALAAGDTVLAPLLQWGGDAQADALPLRLAAALHALVLSGQAPALAARYPGGEHCDGDVEALWAQVRAALTAHAVAVATFLASPPQTNEAARSAVLLGGFLAVARRFALPLRLLELGASAGLNLAWDRYAYTLAGYHWGVETAQPHLAPSWSGPAPDLDAPLTVAERHACDRQPPDLDDPHDRLRLRAYVWPEHAERRARLDAAMAAAMVAGVHVERADAGAWLPRRLAEPGSGCTTVVYHSIFWHYLPSATRAQLQACIESAGARASAHAPLAWLRLEFERAEAPAVLSLTCWPGGDSQRLAHADGHARHVEWLGGDADASPIMNVLEDYA